MFIAIFLFRSKLSQQVIGMPLGSNSAPFLQIFFFYIKRTMDIGDQMERPN